MYSQQKVRLNSGVLFVFAPVEFLRDFRRDALSNGCNFSKGIR